MYFRNYDLQVSSVLKRLVFNNELSEYVLSVKANNFFLFKE
jgi:hypothetical protein